MPTAAAAPPLTTLQHVLQNVIKVDEATIHLEEAMRNDDFVDLDFAALYQQVVC